MAEARRLQQPDLNWRNPSVRNAMADILRFWMKRGIDGFRVDAIPNLVEDAWLRDTPPEDEQRGLPRVSLRLVFTADRPERPEFVANRKVLPKLASSQPILLVSSLLECSHFRK